MTENKENKTPEGKVILITSGKGGVGKTTTAASLGVALAQSGEKTVIIDFDLGLKKLDLILGCEDSARGANVADIVTGRYDVEQALVTGLFKKYCGQNLAMIPASSEQDKTVLAGREESVKKMFDELKALGYVNIIVDSPAGIEDGAKQAMRYADEVIVIVQPELQSIRDALKIISEMKKYSLRTATKSQIPLKMNFLVTGYNKKAELKNNAVVLDEIIDAMKIDNFLGTIVESKEDVIKASTMGIPVILAPNNKSNISQDYYAAAKRFQGDSVYTNEKVSFFRKLFR